jgi:hypothetical protein
MDQGIFRVVNIDRLSQVGELVKFLGAHLNRRLPNVTRDLNKISKYLIERDIRLYMAILGCAKRHIGQTVIRVQLVGPLSINRDELRKMCDRLSWQTNCM